jgi:hypothetical protein
MNHFGTIAVLAVGLALTTANLCAEPTAASTAEGANAVIADGRVVTTASPLSPQGKQQSTPPKITLTGIATASGSAKVLYKVAGAGKDEFFISKEGEEQDGVTVVTVDAKKNAVMFQNHGVLQEIVLANGPAGGETSVAPDVTNPTFQYPKPGDSNYAEQQSVTAPLPKNRAPTIAAQGSPDQAQVGWPGGTGQPTQSAAMINGGGVAGGGGTPPGHGGF